MKKLSSFITEKLQDKQTLLKQLASKSNLADYVKYLNKMLQNNDAKKVLINAFIDGENPNYSFECDTRNIKVTDLHPTQSEIDVNKSLGYPFLKMETADACMKMFFEDSYVKMPFPLITFEGKWIIDGHHRWSQVYTFNPKAEMECFDISIKGGKVSPNEMLKIVQGMLAAKRAEDGKGNIPSNKVEGANLFKMTEDEVKKTIISYCEGEGKEEIAKRICSATGNDTVEDLAEYLCDNLMKLQKDYKQDAAKGNNRGVMPQTDKGGDDPDNPVTAEPDKNGSVLNKLSDDNTKTQHKVIKK